MTNQRKQAICADNALLRSLNSGFRRTLKEFRDAHQELVDDVVGLVLDSLDDDPDDLAARVVDRILELKGIEMVDQDDILETAREQVQSTFEDLNRRTARTKVTRAITLTLKSVERGLLYDE